MEWQSIDTAPKDGTSVLLHRSGYSWVGRYYHDETYSFGKLKRTSEGWTSDRMFMLGNNDNPPTHWLPIPPGP